jgi:hypothetical protein
MRCVDTHGGNRNLSRCSFFAVLLLAVAGGAPVSALRPDQLSQSSLTVSPEILDFGSNLSVGVTSDQTLTITNAGAAQLSGWTWSLNGPLTIVGGTCGSQSANPSGLYQLNAGQSCTFLIRFTGTSVGGTGGALSFGMRTKDAPSGTFDQRWDGIWTATVTSTSNVALIVTPAVLDFGTVPKNAPNATQTLTVSNAGTVGLKGLTLQGPSSVVMVTGGTCGNSEVNPAGLFTLAAGQSCTCVYRLLATTEGAVAGSLQAAMQTDAGVVRSASSQITATVLTDSELLPDIVVVKIEHIAELRARMDAFRVGNGLPAFAWTDPVIIPEVTPLKAVHITELRGAVEEAYTRAGRPLPTWTDPILVSGMGIRALHLQEIRTAITGFNALSLTPAILDFDKSQLTDSPVDRLITVTNTGGGTLTGWQLSHPNLTAVLGGTCGSSTLNPTGMQTLSPGKSCTWKLRFTPSVLGAAGGTLRVAMTAAGGSTGDTASTAEWKASVVTEGGGSISVEPNILPFGEVPLAGYADRTVTVTNVGGSELKGFHWSVEGKDTMTVVGGTCASSSANPSGKGLLKPGESCTYVLRYTAVREGPLSGKWNFGMWPLNQDPFKVPIPDAFTSLTFGGTVTGPAGGSISLTPAAFNFGTVTVGGTPVDRPLTVTNTGVSRLSGWSWGFGGLTLVAGGTCGSSAVNPTGLYSLDPGQSCTFMLRFAPTSSGLKEGTMTVKMRVPGTTTWAVTGTASYTGTATQPGKGGMAITPSLLDFGTVPLNGGPIERTLTVANVGTVRLGGWTSGFDGLPLVAGGTCGSSAVNPTGLYFLEPGQSCTFRLRFNPQAVGKVSGSLFLGMYSSFTSPVVFDVTQAIPWTATVTATDELSAQVDSPTPASTNPDVSNSKPRAGEPGRGAADKHRANADPGSYLDEVGAHHSDWGSRCSSLAGWAHESWTLGLPCYRQLVNAIGGPRRDRTFDPLVKSQVLYH